MAIFILYNFIKYARVHFLLSWLYTFNSHHATSSAQKHSIKQNWKIQGETDKLNYSLPLKNTEG